MVRTFDQKSPPHLLVLTPSSLARAGKFENDDVIKAIGRRLHKLGGMDLMRSTHAAFQRKVGRDPIRSSDGRLLENAWSGIGEWMA